MGLNFDLLSLKEKQENRKKSNVPFQNSSPIKSFENEAPSATERRVFLCVAYYGVLMSSLSEALV